MVIGGQAAGFSRLVLTDADNNREVFDIIVEHNLEFLRRVLSQAAPTANIQIVQGTGFGMIGDLVIGIVGAFLGGWLLPQLGIHLGSGIIAAIINATIGALVLLLIIRLVRGGGGWGRSWGGGWGRRW